MIDFILYYIFPNIVLFGGIFIFAKVFEKLTWEMILFNCEPTDPTNLFYSVTRIFSVDTRPDP